MQVLKEEVRERILAAAVQVFYEKDFRSAKMQDIAGTPSERFRIAAEEPLLDMLAHHKLLVILIDKSRGTAYEHAKDDFVESIERHIRRMVNERAPLRYPDLLAHVLASNFVESLMEVARHYSSEDESRDMLALIAQCYYEGVNSL